LRRIFALRRGREPPDEPRQWNLWDLERLRREAGADPARADERSFVLLHLREFADADGALPATFDSLVRETFGDLVGSRRR
jgi:hypothetical protein